MRIIVTPAARRDIDDILDKTLVAFGERQLAVYAGYFDRALGLLAEDPLRASSRERPEVSSGLRSFHLAIAARKVSAAVHVMFYRLVSDDRGERAVLLVRVLHQSMDATGRLAET